MINAAVQEKNQQHPMSERMSALAESFPTLKGAPGVRPWRPALLAHWVRVQKGVLDVKDGSVSAGSFVLNVWSGTKFLLPEPGNTLTVVVFDLFEALKVWDDPHRAAFLAWVKEPFFP